MARRNEYRGKWKISKHTFLMALHFAYQYNDWKAERDRLVNTSRAITYSDMPHGTSIPNPTEEVGMRIAELSDRIELVEQTAKEADAEIYPWLLKAVTEENVGYDFLKLRHEIPCGKDMYQERRRKFYYLLSGKICK